MRSQALSLSVLGVVSAAFLIGLATLANGAARSAVLVDSLAAENTVATPELSAAGSAVLLGLVVSIVSAAIAVVLLLRARRERTEEIE